MAAPQVQLRLVQAVCVALVVGCILISRLEEHKNPNAITPTQWLVVFAAIWSAISGFRLQRKVVRVRNRPQSVARKSTPFSRWKAGNLLRLAAATAVGLWGLVLYQIGGPMWLVDTLFTGGMALLLTWMPGTSPDPNQP